LGLLQGTYDIQFLRWADAGKDVCPIGSLGKLLRTKPLELTGIEYPRGLAGGQTNLCGNRKGRQELISSKHHGPYPGLVQPPDEVPNAWPDGVTEASEPKPD